MKKLPKKVSDKRTQHPLPQQNKVAVQKDGPSALLALIVVVVLGTIIYSNSFDCSFHLDDNPSIVMNKTIRDLSDTKAIWDSSPSRFTSYWSFALNYHFGAYDVWGYHLFNLFIHLINACLVYWVTTLLFATPVLQNEPAAKNKSGFAFAAALLFVSHPLATQSVTYIVQRMASMVCLFYLLSVALYLKGRLRENNGAARFMLFGGAVLAALLAIYTKENAFTLPLAVVLVEVCFFRANGLAFKLTGKQWTLLTAGAIALAAAVVSRFSSAAIFKTIPPELGNTYTLTPWTYLLTQFSVIVKYIQLLILPIHQNLDHDFPVATGFFDVRTILSFLLLTGLLATAVYLFNRKRLISFGIFWFFLTLSIESSIVPISDVIFEHRTYLPSLGFFLVLLSVGHATLWTAYRKAAVALLLLVVCANSVLAYQRNAVWKTEETLWKSAVQQAPGKARPYVNLGMYYIDRNDYAAAAPYFTKAYALNKDYFDAANNLGVCEVAMGDNSNAIVHFSKALDLDTTYARVYFGRGLAWIGLSEWNKAISDFTKAIAINPGYAKAFGKRGYSWSRLSQWDNALQDFDHALQIDSTLSNVYFDRGRLYGITGKYALALKDLDRAVALEPTIPDGYFNRAITYENLGAFAKAAEDYDSYLRLKPNDSVALRSRDECRLKSKNTAN